MDAVLLARIQFALTVGFHFIFPPITIGMAWMIFWFLNKYRKTSDQLFARTARFWTRIFTMTFVVGVATGIVMEFQFGTNWASYSRFVGDIFGAPLAAEGIFSFFLESTFVAVLVFGWEKLSKRTLWFSSLMVAIGATLSALWILIANSWMQTPAGYHMVGSRAELTNFWEAALNPSTLPRFLHTIDAALVTGAFFIVSISAWYLLKNRHLDVAKTSMKAALTLALVASVLQLGLGHYHAMQVAHTQPEKLATIEGLNESGPRAPALLFGIADDANKRVTHTIKIPGLLSLMAFGSVDAEVKGLDSFEKDELPPVSLTFYPFHIMVGLGALFVLMPIIGIYLYRKDLLMSSRWFLKGLLFMLPLPTIANELGWMTAEVGRQPWAVYHVLRTSDAVSVTVPAGQILFSIILFSGLYLTLFTLWVYLVRHQVKIGPDQR